MRTSLTTARVIETGAYTIIPVVQQWTRIVDAGETLTLLGGVHPVAVVVCSPGGLGAFTAEGQEASMAMLLRDVKGLEEVLLRHQAGSV